MTKIKPQQIAGVLQFNKEKRAMNRLLIYLNWVLPLLLCFFCFSDYFNFAD